MAKKKKKGRYFYDLSLLYIVIFLICFGLLMIYSSSSYAAQLEGLDANYYMRHQAIAALIGLAAMIIFSVVDYHWYFRLDRLGILLSIALMILVSLVGKRVNGKRRWLGVGSLTFQPTELVKIAVIIALAAMIVRLGQEVDSKRGRLQAAIIVLPLFVLVAKNNLSSGIIVGGIGFVMMYIASRSSWRYLVLAGLGVSVFLSAGILAPYLVKVGILQEYQLSRIMVWKQPEKYASRGGYQVLQGLYAIGSGGIFGKGLGESIQKFILPEAQNDMIFSIICEEFGLFGACATLLGFVFILYRCLLIANNAPDLFGSMLVIGVMAQIAIQVILNVAVVSNAIPNTGITLPFISYGGTSMIFLMVEIGIVLNVSRQIRLGD